MVLESQPEGDDEAPEPWAPDLREYDAQTALLQQILDALVGANWQRGGGKGRPQSSRRPRTAMEKAREQASINLQLSFLDYLLANQQKPDTPE